MSDAEAKRLYSVVCVGPKRQSAIIGVTSETAKQAAADAVAIAVEFFGETAWWPAAVFALGAADLLAYEKDCPGHHGFVGRGR